MHISKYIILGAFVALQLLDRAHAAPVVNLIRPTNGASYAVGTPIVMRASAIASNATLSTLDFVAGTNLIRRFSGPLTNGIYNFSWTNFAAGIHQVQARVMDDTGAEGMSATAQITVTNRPVGNSIPVVTLTQPTNNEVVAVGTPIFLTASATDTDGTISFVEFFSGALNLGRANGPSSNGLYHCVWTNAPAGMYQLRAEAVDNTGGRGLSAWAQVAVSGLTNVPNTNNVIPVVNWLRPTNGSFFARGALILLRASATDADGTISFVDFFSGSVKLGRGTTSTNGVYNWTWTNALPGTYQLHAEAADNAGGVGASAPVQIVVEATNTPPPNARPIVTWIRPTNGADFAAGAPISLTASATDVDGTVSRVEFFAGSVYLARGVKTPTNSLYNLTWTNPPPGIFQLRAEAVDNAGTRGTSAPVQISVGLGVVDLGIVEVPTIGHAMFDPNLPGLPRISPNAVLDFLVDQDQSSGGGGVLQSVAANWDTNNHFSLTISAPPNMKFLVTVPPQRLVRFGGFLWWESTRGGFSEPGDVTASFTDLEGIAPIFDQSDSVLSDSHGFFGFVDLEGTGVTNSFAFTSITLAGTVAPQYTANGTENYLPHLESSMYLAYSTTETNDPGSFISIVPTGPLPRLQMMAVSSEAGTELMVHGKPGRTHIVECSPDTVTWTAIGSGVMPPQGLMTIRDASAATIDSRFYRVVEQP